VCVDDITLYTGNLKDWQKTIGTNKRILQSRGMQNQYCFHIPVENGHIEMTNQSQLLKRKIQKDKFNPGRKIYKMTLIPSNLYKN
jgi:hypothetical protein